MHKIVANRAARQCKQFFLFRSLIVIYGPNSMHDETQCIAMCPRRPHVGPVVHLLTVFPVCIVRTVVGSDCPWWCQCQSRILSRNFSSCCGSLFTHVGLSGLNLMVDRAFSA